MSLRARTDSIKIKIEPNLLEIEEQSQDFEHQLDIEEHQLELYESWIKTENIKEEKPKISQVNKSESEIGENSQANKSESESESVAKEFICDYDGKVFKTRAEIYNHVRRHNPFLSVKVKCEICEVEVQKRYLNVHKLEVHTDKRFKCDICGFRTKARRLIRQHKTKHKKKFECDICHKAFQNRPKLKIHITAVHLKEKKVNKKQRKRYVYENPVERRMCEICGKSVRIQNLELHQRTHEKKEKEFKCDKCPRAFYNSFFLERHLKTHQTDEVKLAAMKNPEKCEICSKYLSSKRALIVHMKTVHQEDQVKHPCAVCEKLFKNERSLKTHIRNTKCGIITD